MKQVRMGRPKVPLVLSASEREQLQGIGKSRSLPNGIVRRARMVLMSVDEVSNTQIAARMGTSVALVSFWRGGTDGRALPDCMGRCVRAPATHDDERIADCLTRC